MSSALTLGRTRPAGTLRRHGRTLSSALAVAFMALALSSCGGAVSTGDGTDTEPLPLQESAFAVSDDVAADARPVRSVAITEEQLTELAEVCGQAQGIPLEDGDECVTFTELVIGPPCKPTDICIRVYDARGLDANAAGYVEVVDGRDDSSRCESDSGRVCLRVGVTRAVVARVTDTDPTSTTPSPSDSPTQTPTETPSETPAESATETPSTSSDTEASPTPETLTSTSPP